MATVAQTDTEGIAVQEVESGATYAYTDGETISVTEVAVVYKGGEVEAQSGRYRKHQSVEVVNPFNYVTIYRG